jgi:quercetin dioxygenase-like cupin family protein
VKSVSKVCIGMVIIIAAATLGTRAVIAQKPGETKKAGPPATKKAASAAPKHVLLAPGDLKWGPAPDALPPGAQLAVVDGDPSKAAPFSVQIKFPAGYRVPPHWHPNDENVVVLSGTFMVGMGDKMDESSMQSLAAGGYGKVPRQMHHYAMAKTEATIHLYGMGPFAITYVNPSDDPRKKTTAK